MPWHLCDIVAIGMFLMSGRRQTSHTTLNRTRTAANYSLPSISAVPGRVVEQILPAITTKNLKSEKRTASRDLERAHCT